MMKVGQEVEIVGFGDQRKTVVTGIEMFHKTVDVTEPGRRDRPATPRH